VSFLLRIGGIGTKGAAAADVTAPALVSAQIPAAGTTIEITFTEAVSIGAGGNGGFVLDTSGAAVTLTYSSGAGTGTLIYTLSRTIAAGETILDFDYTQPGNGVEDAAGNDLATFTNQQALVTNNASDVTAPTLSNPVDDNAGETDGALTVDTDEANGTLYWVISTSSSAPSAAQVKAGQMHTGAAAADSGSQAVVGTGTQTITGESGLTASTTYYAHFMHEDAATNQSTVSSGNGFTTDAPDVTAPTLSSASIPTTGDSLSIVFDETVSIGAGGNGGFTIAMSGGAVSLTYASGSGSNTLVYTTDRTIDAGETCSDFDYTQPGNGVEDAAGNDLATFTNQQAQVTNNSTEGGDPEWANVSLLLANQNADGGASFPDQSSNAHTVTVVNNTDWVNTTAPTGWTWVAALDGTNDFLTVADHASLQLGSGDFTIEMFVRTGNTGTQRCISKGVSGGNFEWGIDFVTASTIRVYASSNGSATNILNLLSMKASWSINTWYHIALTRSGTTWEGYVDGVRGPGFPVTSAATIFASGGLVTVGGNADQSLDWNGQIASVRITKGTARYTGASFTPPSEPFLTS
jgi:hypothetical protein